MILKNLCLTLTAHYTEPCNNSIDQNKNSTSVAIPIFLNIQIQQGVYFYLFYTLVYPMYLAQFLGHSKPFINI